jgi:hypothetical protein
MGNRDWRMGPRFVLGVFAGWWRAYPHNGRQWIEGRFLQLRFKPRRCLPSFHRTGRYPLLFVDITNPHKRARIAAIPHRLIVFADGTIIVRVGDGGGIEHIHQAGETPRSAVMWSDREHDQSVGPPGQQPGELVPLRRFLSAVGHILSLVDHDNVPIGILLAQQTVASLAKALGTRLSPKDHRRELLSKIRRKKPGPEVTPLRDPVELIREDRER